jgi:A1 cistron-splicing factor AAR2
MEGVDGERAYLAFGTLVCLDVPAGTHFGVDWTMHQTGPAFLGMKLLPPGLHLCVYGSELHSVAFFFEARAGRLAAARWDAEAEALVRLDDEAELERLTAAAHRGELDGRLAPYDAAAPLSTAADGVGAAWARFAGHIDAHVLARAGLALWQTVLPDGFDDDAPDVPPPAPGTPRAAAFTRLRARRPAAQRAGGAPPSAAELTAYNLDGSGRLEELLAGTYASHAPGAPAPWRALLGELQLACVLLLCVHAHGGLVFWREGVALLCGCERALLRTHAHASLFAAFADLLREQLLRLPADLFVDALSSRNFLGPALAAFRSLVDVEACPRGVREAAGPLWATLAERFNLDEDALAELLDGDDEAPVVVGADEAGGDDDADTVESEMNTRALRQALEALPPGCVRA